MLEKPLSEEKLNLIKIEDQPPEVETTFFCKLWKSVPFTSSIRRLLQQEINQSLKSSELVQLIGGDCSHEVSVATASACISSAILL